MPREAEVGGRIVRAYDEPAGGPKRDDVDLIAVFGLADGRQTCIRASDQAPFQLRS